MLCDICGQPVDRDGEWLEIRCYKGKGKPVGYTRICAGCLPRFVRWKKKTRAQRILELDKERGQ